MPLIESPARIFFEKICALAKAQDIMGLKQLLSENNLSVDLRCGIETPAYRLAKEGAIGAVELLIGRFDASIHWAAEGYQAGGYDIAAQNLIDQGAQIGPDEAESLIFSYASTGDQEKVDELLLLNQTSNDIEGALWGYSLSGFENAALQLLTKFPDKKEEAIYTFALGGHLNSVQNLLKETPMELRSEILYGFATGKHMKFMQIYWHPDNLNDAIAGLDAGSYLANANVALRTLAWLPSDDMGLAIMFHLEQSDTFSFKEILPRARLMQRLIQENNLSYNSAYVWCDEKARDWFLTQAPSAHTAMLSQATQQFTLLSELDVLDLIAYATTIKRRHEQRMFPPSQPITAVPEVAACHALGKLQ